ncbi:sigma-70 family RNA polymerase sigma factor [Dankookia rubra]|uniref:Sigma-70 family RNA polymerase sigma factor n=1 Tax=Dankookia rubra TaxID=1442381 RepID=A0A4V3AA83_9PROT|nr:sigma-70 family RNA polymerase sigma factor [Dankookia rubra]TDH62115.1 sigma-70 family RNA polymerase sigma factor [Dankookia rubra]
MRDHDGPLPCAGSATSHAAVRASIAEEQAKLRGVVIRHLHGDRHGAEDVLQRFALRALERAGELRDPERVHGWLARVLSSTLADYGRELARRRECSEDPQEFAEVLVAPEPEAAAWVCDCIEPLLGAMRPDQAALIRRLDLHGESREGVAAELDVLPNALHVRHHRARRALATLLLAACVTCPAESFMHCACPKPPTVEEARRARVTA